MQRQHDFPSILNQILHEDRPVPHRQLKSLSNLSPEELDTFCQAWSAASTKRRQRVAQALVRLAEDNLNLNFRDILLVCLKDEDQVVREVAIEGLGDDESHTLLEQLLLMAVEDPSVEVRVGAILALGRFAYQIETTGFLGDYREPLLRLLLGIFKDAAAPLELRRRAVESVSYFSGAPEVEEAIVQSYDTPDREMRISAVHAMGHHMDSRWRPFIEAELSSADPALRYEAARASGELADPELVIRLTPLLEDEDHEVARAAIWSLGEIGGQQARRLLKQCLRRPEEDIREAAEEALHTLRFFEDPLGTF